MDKQTVALFIPIIVLSIPLVAVVFNGLQKIARLRLEEARMRVQGATGGGEVQTLRAEVEELRHELGEVQERLDFAERLLARRGEPGRLPGAQ